MSSLTKKIDQAETVYKETLKRLTALEEKIKARKFPKDKEEQFITELTEVRKRLGDHEEHIRHLKTHNRSFFVLMVVFMFICCALFMIYVLVFGPPSVENTEAESLESKSQASST